MKVYSLDCRDCLLLLEMSIDTIHSMALLDDATALRLAGDDITTRRSRHIGNLLIKPNIADDDKMLGPPADNGFGTL